MRRNFSQAIRRQSSLPLSRWWCLYTQHFASRVKTNHKQSWCLLHPIKMLWTFDRTEKRNKTAKNQRSVVCWLPATWRATWINCALTLRKKQGV